MHCRKFCILQRFSNIDLAQIVHDIEMRSLQIYICSAGRFKSYHFCHIYTFVPDLSQVVPYTVQHMLFM
jgi:hypothetical protein